MCLHFQLPRLLQQHDTPWAASVIYWLISTVVTVLLHINEKKQVQLFVFHYYSAPVVVWSIVINQSVCLCVCPRAYLWNRWTDLQAIFVQIPCGCDSARSGGVALRYVVPVLWMSRLAILGHIAIRG